MTRHVTLKEFGEQLPQLMEQIRQGDVLVIDRDGTPLARLVPEKT